MSFIHTFSRETLQGLSAEHRKQILYSQIDNGVANLVLQAAREGKTEYFWITPDQSNKRAIIAHPAHPIFTTDEFIKALLEKFPGTAIGYQETWEEVRPGVKEQRKGILINWS